MITETIAAAPDLARAQRQGWQLLCPLAFSATWNGGSQPEDITIQLAADATAEAGEAGAAPGAFVQSQLGNGLLTFYSGYQFKTAEAYQLWVRGPINAPKAGLAPLDSLVDTALFPCTATIHWQFTHPNQTVHFAAGEPFGLILPHAKSAQENVVLDIEEFTVDEDAYEQILQQMLSNAAVQNVFQEMEAAVLGSRPPEGTQDFDPQMASRWARQLTNPPPVSCLCPTYGRVALLEEAIEAFLRQDYPGEKELIVLNDYAQQTLIFDHPQVRIINLPTRCHSVGEKYKMAAALASHDLLFVWHDDDIYLPHRLSYSVAHLDPTISFFKADQAWFWNAGVLTGPQANLFHGGSCWRRELFTQVQGYPHIDNGYDAEFEQLCRAVAPSALRTEPIKLADLYYLYRWRGTNTYHFSGLGKGGEAGRSVVDYVAQQAKHGAIPQGAVQLHPQWQSDYVALVQQTLTKRPAANGEPFKEEIPFPPPYYAITPPPPLPDAHVEQLFRGDYPRKISVILPAVNESVLLQRTVENFAATLPENSEIIVIDNGSTDGCADFLLAAPCPNIQLIRTTEQLGVSGARNRGLAAAQGEIVVFSDAHIDVPERWWQPLVCALNHPNVGVVGPAIGVMGKPELPGACGQRIAETKLRVEWLHKQRDEAYPVPSLGGGFMAMRHDTLKAAGAFDAGMPQWGSEDLEICLRYWLLGYEVWVAPSVTVLHYFRTAAPYKIEWKSVTHNLLRVALLHLNGERLTRVLAALQKESKFEEALTHAVTSDVWQKRAAFATRQVRNDDWLFEKFADSCPV
jgi:glycosyltransferase involved in cell wall biosynthesis